MKDACWYRVFGQSAQAPDMSPLRAIYTLSADERGWYQVNFPLLWGEIELDRWLPKDDDIRAELNTWAAWVEANAGPGMEWLMRHLVTTQQLFTWSIDSSAVDAAAFSDMLCRHLCEATDGVYQIDGVGFLKGDGTLLVRETP